MFRRITAILVLSYFAFATFCLPQGDFGAITELPAMYRHCKATEDKDLTPIDFLTDHLVNVDCLLDSHDDGDQQKPHSPFTFNDVNQQIFITYIQFQLSFINEIQLFNTKLYEKDSFLPSEYISKIFRPPVINSFFQARSILAHLII